MADSRPLLDQVALVTGASRGIGQGIALALAEAGAKVAGTATTAEGAERVSAALAPYGGKGFALDVTAAGVRRANAKGCRNGRCTPPALLDPG